LTHIDKVAFCKEKGYLTYYPEFDTDYCLFYEEVPEEDVN